MALANLTGRHLRVYIGADQQDWSLAAGIFSVGQQSLSDSGLVQVSGTLQIRPVLEAPENLDPAENPARWRRGQPVRVETVNQAGAWVQHPLGRLFLLDEPELPGDDGSILLNLGCLLTWHNGFEFDDEKTGIVVGTPTNSAAVAESLLVANEISGAALDLGTWPYALAIPEGKGQNTSFVQQAGGLAHANDWRYLWQRPDGVVTATALDLGIAAPLVTITLGSNDVLYRRIKVEGSPPERIKVAGAGTVVTEAQNPSVTVAEVVGDRSQFGEGGVSCPGSGVISRSTTTVWWDATNHYTKSVLESPRSAVAARPGIIDGPCSLTAWKETLVHKQYASADKRLLTITTTERRRAFALSEVLASRGALNWYTVRETVEVPVSSDREVLERIVVSEQVALITLDSAASGGSNTATDPARLIDASENTTRWRQLGATTWQQSEIALIPRAFTNASPETSPTATIGTASTTTSSTGQNQPPRCEFFDEGRIEEDVEYQGTAEYTLPGGAGGYSRKALYTVPYGFSQSQCEGLALKHVALIAGRHRAALIEFPITDALLTAPPLFPCDVVMTDGEIRHYRVDGLAWEHGETVAKAVGTGILVGMTPAPTIEVPAPTPAPLTAVPVIDEAVAVTDSAAQVFAVV